jgi:hypothetical protein
VEGEPAKASDGGCVGQRVADDYAGLPRVARRNVSFQIVKDGPGRY